jgi:hypothetical protein
VMPWDIPEPEEIQGLDCIDKCKKGGSGIASTETGDSGCSVVGGKSFRLLPLLLLVAAMGVLLTTRRRRHRR